MNSPTFFLRVAKSRLLWWWLLRVTNPCCMPNGLMNEGAKKMHTMTTTNQIHYTCSESRLCSDSHNIIHQSLSVVTVLYKINNKVQFNETILPTYKYLVLFLPLCNNIQKHIWIVAFFPILENYFVPAQVVFRDGLGRVCF